MKKLIYNIVTASVSLIVLQVIAILVFDESISFEVGMCLLYLIMIHTPLKKGEKNTMK